MKSKYPVDSLYTAAFKAEDATLHLVFSFFRDILGMTCYSYDSIVHELEWLKEQKSADVGLITKQYERLNAEVLKTDAARYDDIVSDIR